MKRAIPPPTKDEQRRQDIIRELGCLACMLDGHPQEPTEIQHMNSCGRNISQLHTFGLCPWHHRGVCRGALTTSEMLEHVGPSYAIHRFAFVQRYGRDEELLKKQNMLVEAYMRCVI